MSEYEWQKALGTLNIYEIMVRVFGGQYNAIYYGTITVEARNEAEAKQLALTETLKKKPWSWSQKVTRDQIKIIRVTLK